MFIPIGGEVVVSTKDIVAIIDANEVNVKNNILFIEKVENDKQVEKITTDDIKSFVITNDKVYYSPISISTLKRRANY
ncbi:hypothetical protein BHF71_08030 [Vulcanibacillus modesticaldus]|uniref:DUF370 domain-containing protein n=1 Tax=Vulcanibacillus modesticaldus TaxID=337097 RepID=A0A1D2YV82_9BACI|nr:extracellular matrix/biofilm biosynthesis regulator RemA family protein [Vulcanibacillus modesticaldus]OEF99632.1 hypothetical protein BHF71_08030 [Vulcanibacillus modesticaldus]